MGHGRPGQGGDRDGGTARERPRKESCGLLRKWAMMVVRNGRGKDVPMDLTAWLEQEPAQRLRGRDLLADSDLKPDEVAWLLDFALAMKAAGPNGARHLLPGRTVALLFEKPSTRTRVSFEVAVWQLGGIGLSLNVGDLQMSRGETIEDTGRVLSRYVQGIVMRTFGQSRLQALAEAASVPVVNALSDRFHPCQIMADLLTLKERFGRLAGLHLVY